MHKRHESLGNTRPRGNRIPRKLLAAAAPLLIAAACSSSPKGADSIGNNTGLPSKSGNTEQTAPSFNPGRVDTAFQHVSQDDLTGTDALDYATTQNAVKLIVDGGDPYEASELIDNNVDDTGSVTRAVAHDAIDPYITQAAIQEAKDGDFDGARKTIEAYVDDGGSYTKTDAAKALSKIN